MSESISLNDSLIASEKFLKLCDHLISDDPLPEALKAAAEVLCRNLNAERATIYLIEKGTQTLYSAAAIGNVTRSIRIPISNTSLAGFCALTGRSFVVPDAYGDLASIDPEIVFDKTWDELNRFRTRDVMCSPAVFKQETIGTVQVMNSLSEPFGAADLPVLKSVSRLVGYTLYHARVLDDLKTLKRVDQQKAEFMRIMVHELKSPVSASKMMADVMELQHPDNDDILSTSQKISGRMDQLLDLIKDILELSKVKEGGPLGDVSVLDVVAMAGEICRQYSDPAAQKGLALAVELPEGPVPVRFDSQGFRLVLSNLVSNAVKYTPAGSVTIRLRVQDAWAAFQISDTGIGIPGDEIPKLFREFYRASNAKRSRVPGSGVGLAIVKNMVERFDGEMTLDTREDEGSTFTVRLPLHAG